MIRKKEDEWTPERVASELAKAVDLVSPMLEAVTGYRAKCIEAGFNETAAEMMAVQFHGLLLGNRA